MQDEVSTAVQAQVQPTVEPPEAASTAGEAVPETVSKSETTEKEKQRLTLEALKPGMQVKGKVRSVVEFGAFVDIGVGRDGLVHVSSLKKAGVDKTIKVGDEIEVAVRRVDPEEHRISLIIPLPKEAKIPLRELRVGSVVTGKVVRLVDFGAFVDIGAQVDALLHVSQIGGYVNHPSQVLKVGDEIRVRINEVDVRKRRVSLTMRDLEEEGAKEAASEKPKPEEHIPTAFEVALEKARLESRRRRTKRL